MLARRELSEAQVRQRLARREHDAEAIDAAVARLRAERAIDDTRVAEIIARTQSSVHRRGKLRVVRQIERAGISRETARRAADAVYGALDGDELLDACLARRLRGEASIADEKEFGRLYRYLLGQGFESDRVVRTLMSRRRR
jgi:regulatory protein